MLTWQYIFEEEIIDALTVFGVQICYDLHKRTYNNQMAMAEQNIINVEVEKDFINRTLTGRPVQALTELVWNAFDADAENVYVKLNHNELGLESVEVIDDGTGVIGSNTIGQVIDNPMNSKELDEKLVGLINDLEELSNAISRASTENDSEKLAKLLENRTELEAECKKIERKRYELI